MGSQYQQDWAGQTIVCKDVQVGATTPGGQGTALSSTELGFLDTVTASSGVVASKAVIANSSGFVPVVPNTALTTTTPITITAAQSGGVFILDKADGIVYTLPAPSVGLMYTFVVKTSVTSNAYKISTATQNTDFFDGTVVSMGDAAAATAVFTANGSTHDNISMNGTTTGGLVGTVIYMVCTAATKWTVWGQVVANGTEATPFATS